MSENREVVNLTQNWGDTMGIFGDSSWQDQSYQPNDFFIGDSWVAPTYLNVFFMVVQWYNDGSGIVGIDWGSQRFGRAMALYGRPIA